MASGLGSGDLPGSNNNKASPSASEDERESAKRQKLGGAASVEKKPADDSAAIIPGDAKIGPSSSAEQQQDLAQATRAIKKTIKYCINMSTRFEETVGFMESTYKVPRLITKIFWEHLYKENPRSFIDHYSRCKPAAEARGCSTWCKLLSQSGQYPSPSIYTPSFTIGSSGICDFILGDRKASEMLCTITNYNGLAVLEVIGTEGSVRLNGRDVVMNFECLLQSGDEVIFSSYAFIFQNMSGVAVRRGGHQMPSSVTSASILSSLVSFRKDLPRLNSSSNASSKSHQATPMVQDGAELRVDGMEMKSSVNNQSGKAAHSESTSSQSQDSRMAILDEKSELLKISQQASTSRSGSGNVQPSSIFREYIQTGIVEGESLDVSFESFPYYLSENTKVILIAASRIHLKQKEFAKYAHDFTTLSPRILLSGPAGSEIYQEMLSKALAKYFKAKLLIFDSHTLGALTSKEIESLDDGFASEKSCTLPRSYGAPANHTLANRTLTKGDRVRFNWQGQPDSRLPSYGAKGKVVLVFDDNPSSKMVGVRFDKPLRNGVDLGDLCEKEHGFFCKATDLQFESSASEDLDILLHNTLFEVVHAESRVSPFILFLKDIEKIDVGNSGSYSAFKSSLEHLPENVIVIGSQTQCDNRKEKDIGQLRGLGKEVPEATKLLSNLFGNKATIDMPQDIGQLRGLGKKVPEASKLLSNLFGNKVTIDMPQVWNHQLDSDVEYLKMKANVSHLRMVMRRSGLECDGIEKLCMKDLTLQRDSMYSHSSA